MWCLMRCGWQRMRENASAPEMSHLRVWTNGGIDGNGGQVREVIWGRKIKSGFSLVEFEYQQQRDVNGQFEIQAEADF